MSEKKGYGFQTYLLVLTLVALTPVVLVSGFAVWKAGAAYKQTAIVRLSDTARTVASAVEADIRGRFTFLNEVASTRQALSDFKPVQLMPSAYDGIGVDGVVFFVDPANKMDGPELDSSVAVGQEAIVRQLPTISNLRLGEKRGDHRLLLALPVADGSAIAKRAIVLSAAPSQIVRTLQLSNSVLDGMLVAVTDGNGRILARSRDPERSIGVMAPDWDKLIALDSDSGWFEAITTEGRTTVLSFQTLRGTPGWRVVVGESLQVFNARWRDPLIGLGVGGSLAVFIAIVLAFAIGRRVILPVAVLAKHCQDIAVGRLPTSADVLAESRVREFEILRKAVLAAERVQNEQERRLTAVSQVGALVLWRSDAAGALIWVRGWLELTGTPENEALGNAWFSKIHPNDRLRLLKDFRRIMALRGAVDIEFRLRVGVDVWTWVRARGAPIRNELGELIEWEGVLEDIDERKQAEARIAHMAHHDVLTGLANRALLTEKLRQAVSTARPDLCSALLSLDLDRFKEVNDTLGHPIGDALLQAVADRLKSCVRQGDFVARVGGDEFNIIQSDSPQPESAAALANRLIDVIGDAYEINGHRVVIGTSIGITLITDRPLDLDQYLQQADKALYRSKNHGRGRAHFYEEEIMVEEMAAVLKAANMSRSRANEQVS